MKIKVTLANPTIVEIEIEPSAQDVVLESTTPVPEVKGRDWSDYPKYPDKPIPSIGTPPRDPNSRVLLVDTPIKLEDLVKMEKQAKEQTNG